MNRLKDNIIFGLIATLSCVSVVITGIGFITILTEPENYIPVTVLDDGSVIRHEHHPFAVGLQVLLSPEQS